MPIAGSEYTLEVDTIIPAIAQEEDVSFLETESWKQETGKQWLIGVRHGRIFIDEAGATTLPGIFAGGDIATPFGTVAHAVGSGKRAALAIDRYLRGEDLEGFPPIDEAVHAVPKDVDPTVVRFEDLNLAYFEEMERTEQAQRPIAERVRGFEEVNLGFGEDEARAEAERCCSCGTCNFCDTCFIFCPDVAISRVDHRGYKVNYDYCKGCGVCAAECSRYAISMGRE